MIFKKYKTNRFTILLIFALLLATFIPINTAYAEIEALEAPLNPEFIKYLEEIDKPGYGSFSLEPYGKRLIPEPIVIEKDPDFVPFQIRTATFPDKFDLRTTNKLTPVKNQGKNGSCWAFATYSSLESWLMPNEEWDFSENHMKNTHGFDHGHDAGGNRTMSTAYLARWSGPVLEIDDEFKEDDGNSPEVLPIQKQVKDVLFLPARTNGLDNDYIKWALMNHGAVQSSYYDSKIYFNSETNSYYHYKDEETNHAIAIVGWDDNYDKSNFGETPPGNGAFIVKNSWGGNWGDNGYFYISYYDTNIGKSNSVYINAENVGHYDNIYQYDPLGHTSNMGLGGNTAWFANAFNSKDEEENLVAASFYTSKENASYEIWIDTDFKNEDFSKLKKVKEGTIEIPGYHTIDFEPELIEPGKTFVVAVKMATPNYGYPIPVEVPISGYTSKATANEGESYVSPNGKFWVDLTTYFVDDNGKLKYPNDNVNLKAFTKNSRIPVSNISLDRDKILLQLKQQKTLVATILPEDATDKDIIWTSSNEKVAIVDGNGVITGISEGETIIKATSVDNEGIYAETMVKVSKYPVVIDDVKLNENKVNIGLNRANDDMKGVVIVQAFDKNNRVLELKYSDLGILKDNYSFDFSTLKEVNYVKVFVWDSLNNMRPLAEVR